jgi:hypothetical protein
MHLVVHVLAGFGGKSRRCSISPISAPTSIFFYVLNFLVELVLVNLVRLLVDLLVKLNSFRLKRREKEMGQGLVDFW